jgi:hypothetical protein
MPNPAARLEATEELLNTGHVTAEQALRLLNGERAMPNSRPATRIILDDEQDEAPIPAPALAPRPDRDWRSAIATLQQPVQPLGSRAQYISDILDRAEAVIFSGKKPKPTTKFKMGAYVILHENVNKYFKKGEKYKILYLSQYNQHFELTLVNQVGKEERTLYIMSNNVTLFNNDRKPSWF